MGADRQELGLPGPAVVQEGPPRGGVVRRELALDKGQVVALELDLVAVPEVPSRARALQGPIKGGTHGPAPAPPIRRALCLAIARAVGVVVERGVNAKGASRLGGRGAIAAGRR